jgi:hypothetical protein
MRRVESTWTPCTMIARLPCHTCTCCPAASGVKEPSGRRDQVLLHAAQARASVMNRSWRQGEAFRSMAIESTRCLTDGA